MKFFGIDVKCKMLNAKFSELCVIDQSIQRKVFNSHSQYLEDVFIETIFKNKSNGNYVDIGANDPNEISNTRKFYEIGWTGINIEPNVKLCNKLNTFRPKDTNLNIGIGNNTGGMTFYELDPDTLSTFSKKSAVENMKQYNAKIVSETVVDVITLNELFDRYCNNVVVDFLSLDSEGYELEILSSNNWNKHRPIVIIVELNQDSDASVIKLLIQYNYNLVYYNGTNGIFIDTHSQKYNDLINDHAGC